MYSRLAKMLLATREVGLNLRRTSIDGQPGSLSIDAILMLGEYYDEAQEQLTDLKVVEYQGPMKYGPIPVNCYSAEEVDVDVKLYTLHIDGPSNNEIDLPQAQTTRLPNAILQDTWSR